MWVAENSVEKIPDGIILRARPLRRREGEDNHHGERYGRKATHGFEPKGHIAIIARSASPRTLENAERGESSLDAWARALASRFLGILP